MDHREAIAEAAKDAASVTWKPAVAGASGAGLAHAALTDWAVMVNIAVGVCTLLYMAFNGWLAYRRHQREDGGP